MATKEKETQEREKTTAYDRIIMAEERFVNGDGPCPTKWAGLSEAYRKEGMHTEARLAREIGNYIADTNEADPMVFGTQKFFYKNYSCPDDNVHEVAKMINLSSRQMLAYSGDSNKDTPTMIRRVQAETMRNIASYWLHERLSESMKSELRRK